MFHCLYVHAMFSSCGSVTCIISDTFTRVLNACDSYFDLKYIHCFINVQFVYNNFISCQATYLSKCLIELRI